MNDCRAILNFRRLRTIQRFNSLIRLAGEDVAQHSYYVAILAMRMGDEINEKAINETGKPEIDMELLLRKALLHDIPECLTGDVLWATKRHNDLISDGIHMAEESMIDDLLKETSSILKGYRKYMMECKDGKEGAIVATADLLELGMYCFEEASMGNPGFAAMLPKVIELIQDSPAHYTDICTNTLCMIRGSSNRNYANCLEV